jgi:FkbM family methyltransferase
VLNDDEILDTVGLVSAVGDTDDCPGRHTAVPGSPDRHRACRPDPGTVTRVSALSSLARRTVSALPQGWRDRAYRSFAHQASDAALLAEGVVAHEPTMRHLAAAGYRPDCIIDIGAYIGAWSAMAASIFPGRPILMVDGNPARRPDLDARVASLGVGAVGEIALLGADAGTTVPFYEIGTGSSVYRELTNLDKQVHELPLHRLDDVADSFFAHVGRRPTDVLMKVDVQGYELEVLTGAPRLLEHVGALVLELSLIPYNEGAPLAHDVIRWLDEHGFVIYDICDLHRRGTDGALFQMDFVFVPTTSRLREGAFWLSETAS